MPGTAILIGDVASCRRMEQQLDLLPHASRPVSLGWVLVRQEAIRHTDGPFLGTIDHLEAVAAHRMPGLALISLPGAMKDVITSIRTRLRRMNVPDRFIPTLEDLLNGTGPRTNFDIDVAQLLDRPPRRIDEAAVRSVIEGRRIAVTGAGGSIGSELSRLVAQFRPAELFLIERSENALFEIDRQIVRRHPDLSRRALLHDVVHAGETRRLFERIRPEVVFHTAAHKHVPMMEDHPWAAIENNFFGTKSVADAAHVSAAERLVFISTDKAVNPVSIMGASKRLAEMYVQHLNASSETAFSIVRFGNVLGSSGSVLEIWSKQVADGGPVTVTHPEMTRYFMTIPEAASLVIQSAALADSGEVFVLDMGEPVRVLELAERFIAMHGLRAQVCRSELGSQPSALPGSMPIVFTGIRPGEKLHEELASDPDGAGIAGRTRHPDIFTESLPPPSPEFVAEMVACLTSRSGSREPAEAFCERIWKLLQREQSPKVVA